MVSMDSKWFLLQPLLSGPHLAKGAQPREARCHLKGTLHPCEHTSYHRRYLRRCRSKHARLLDARYRTREYQGRGRAGRERVPRERAEPRGCYDRDARNFNIREQQSHSHEESGILQRATTAIQMPHAHLMTEAQVYVSVVTNNTIHGTPVTRLPQVAGRSWACKRRLQRHGLNARRWAFNTGSDDTT